MQQHVHGKYYKSLCYQLYIYSRLDGAGDTSKDEVDSGDELEQTRFEREEVSTIFSFFSWVQIEN